MQEIFEPIFHIVYLITILTLGVIIFKKANQTNTSTYYKTFAVMAIILGVGDAFHLLPRAYALVTTGLDDYTKALGFGKLITSITATYFYWFLYKAWKIRFNKVKESWMDNILYALLTSRIALLFFPQNNWLTNNPVDSWEIYRNIPFVLIGIILVYLMLIEGYKNKDFKYIKISIAVLLSFLFYIPVVLYAKSYPLVGMLMVPKTICYVYIIYIVYKEMTTKK